MLGRLFSAGLAALFVTAGLAGDAMADHRKKHRKWLELEFYTNPEFVRMPRSMRYVFGGYIVDEGGEYQTLYDADEEFDESYYDPTDDVVIQPPPKKKSTAVTKAPLAKPVEKPVGAASSAKPAAKKQLASTALAPKPAEREPKAEPVKAASAQVLTCEKAGQIVAGYGFIDVRPRSCDGLVYEFDAERDGRAFAIKIDRSNGELSEVTKQQ